MWILETDCQDLNLSLSWQREHNLLTCEIQIRTVAMDFWASLEHDLRYKNAKQIPPEIGGAMLDCANEIARIDSRMQDIYREIQKLK